MILTLATFILSPCVYAASILGYGAPDIALAAFCWILGFLAMTVAPKQKAAVIESQIQLSPPPPPPAAAEPPSTADFADDVPAPPAVVELRRKIAPLQINVEEATRFINIRHGDTSRAARLYQRNLDWRRAESIDTILDEPPLMPPERETALRMNWDPIVLDGTDRSGRPVMFNDTGRLDLDALSKKGVAMPAVLRRHVRALEKLRQLIARRKTDGSSVSDHHLFIIDVKDGTATRFMTAWKLWANVAACDAKYYPGMVGAICVIRAPSVAQWALGLCKKSILDEATAAKITLDASHDPTAALKAHLAPAQIAQLAWETRETSPELSSMLSRGLSG